MRIELMVLGAVLAAGALLFGFSLGVAVGYAWRDRISRARRDLVRREERRRAELHGGAIPSLSARVAAEETSIHPPTARRTRKKATKSKDPVADGLGKDRKRKPTKPKVKAVTSDVLQEPGSESHRRD